jgi:thymidylate synthase ThyX
MPNALWALLEGGYSRSTLSMRMRFLSIFEEIGQEFEKGKIGADELITVREFAQQLRDGNDLNMNHLLRKAEKFMRKWAVQYGHDSLKDSDVVRFAIENVTQVATTPIEEARLGAYQEKSTRYVEYTRDLLAVPTDLQEFEQDIRDWNNFLLDNYESSKEIILKFLSTQIDRTTFKSDAAYDRTLNAKTFDIIRYFLPATILTSLGVVWPTREAERHISRLMSDPRKEMQEIGKALLEEGKKVSPGLLSHVAVNEFQQIRYDTISHIHKNINLPKPFATSGRDQDAVKLISYDTDTEAKIAASILFEHNIAGNSFQEYLQTCKNIPLIIEPIIKAYFQGRGKFDALPISTELGNLLFEVTVDYGAYRDIKRHRRNLFLAAPFTAEIGFEYPEYVATEQDLFEVKQKIERCAEVTLQLHRKVKEKYPHLAQYVVMFANKQQMIWQMDPRQLGYVVELRTSPAGHHSYRTICQDMYTLAAKKLTILSKYIRVDMSSGEEGRKKQEEKTVAKLQELGASLERIS